MNAASPMNQNQPNGRRRRMIAREAITVGRGPRQSHAGAAADEDYRNVFKEPLAFGAMDHGNRI
jgi:hypothetical protein